MITTLTHDPVATSFLTFRSLAVGVGMALILAFPGYPQEPVQTVDPKIAGALKEIVAYVPGFNGSVRASVRSETSCRCAFQRRDEWAPDLSAVTVTLPDKDGQQFFDLTQLRHPLTHHCQLVAGNLLDFAAMPAVF